MSWHSSPVIFITKYINSPRKTGNVAPSGFMVAKAFRKATNLDPNQNVVEIGCGTGAVTKRIRDLNPLLVEINPTFAKLLSHKFPELTIKQQCAINFLKENNEKIGLICTIPLINNPQAKDLINAISDAYKANKLSYCAVLTYGLKDPLRSIEFSKRKRAWCPINIPPAFVWSYW